MVDDEEPVPEPIFGDETTDVISLTDLGRRRSGKRDLCTLTLLTGVEAGLVYEIEKDETVLGRSHGCQMRIEDSGLSRRHCRVFKRGDAYFVEDLDSRNGTSIDGEAVRTPRKLEDGVHIQMGLDTVVKFAVQNELEMRATRRLYESAMHDPLTGVYNRRYLDEHLQSEFAFAVRHGSSLSLLLIDADHFKKVNDSWGHPAGDMVLRALAGHLQRSVRGEDIIARFGGEEFAVLARETTPQGAMVVAQRIRDSVAKTPVPISQPPAAESPGDAEPAPANESPGSQPDRVVRITVSIGVVHMGGAISYPSAQALLEAADEALYRAKEGGRNRCEQASP